MLSTLVTGGIVFSSLFVVSANNEEKAPNLAKGETQIELPSSELEEIFDNEFAFKSSFEVMRDIKEEGERLQAEREEKLRLEQERIAREKAEAEQRAREEAERIERERLAKIEAQRKAEAQRLAKIEAQKKAEAQRVAKAQQQKAQSEKKVQDKQGMAFNGSYYTPYCTGCSGITATGVDVRSSIYHQGMRVVAVDPRVIPLYSIVEVSTPHETFKAIALDTGGAIKGHKIDILVANKQTAYSLGRHTVYVKVLRSGK